MSKITKILFQCKINCKHFLPALEMATNEPEVASSTEDVYNADYCKLDCSELPDGRYQSCYHCDQFLQCDSGTLIHWIFNKFLDDHSKGLLLLRTPENSLNIPYINSDSIVIRLLFVIDYNYFKTVKYNPIKSLFIY